MTDMINYKIHGDNMQIVETKFAYSFLKRMVTGKGFFTISFSHQRKGKGTVLLAGILTAMLGLSPVQAEPYAAVADTPSKESEFHDLWKMKLSDIQVPERATVDIPPYPGAKIINVMKLGERGAYGPRNTPKIIMLTTDARQEVSAFYRKLLQGWKYREDQYMEEQFEYFWTDAEHFMRTREADQDTPSVVISDMGGPMSFMEKALMPDAKALITIIYTPAKP